MSTAASLESLTVRTVELTASTVADLIGVLPATAPLAWIRHGEGLVGWGEAARLTVSGPDRFERAVRWWRSLGLSPEHDGPGIPGSGPVVFGSFAFADGPTPSVLVLPRVVIGRRNGRTWLTSIGTADEVTIAPTPLPRPPLDVQISDGALSADDWTAAVTAAVTRIRDGELSKVVLARDLLGRADEPIDVRYLLRDLAHDYPDCFTFSVAGLVGATPELLIARHGRRVTSRVLAGTAWHAPDEDSAADAAVAARLTGSDKDREEHDYAVSSAAEALRPYCSRLSMPDGPTVLALSNVTHLATEVTGTLHTEIPALELAGLLHPTAAVCGTPTTAAARMISDLEGMDRGRYAGPVGWMDANGDGEWGIALRCAQVDGARLRLFAGCGIVAGSDPIVELAEAEAKFLAVRRALQG